MRRGECGRNTGLFSWQKLRRSIYLLYNIFSLRAGLTGRARLYLPAFSQTSFANFELNFLCAASLAYDGDLAFRSLKKDVEKKNG